MKWYLFIVALFLSSNSFAEVYNCIVLRSPGVFCNGQNLGNIVGGFEIDTENESFKVASKKSGHLIIDTGLLYSADPKVPCNFRGGTKYPRFSFNVRRDNDQLQLIARSSIATEIANSEPPFRLEPGNPTQIVARPIGTQTLRITDIDPLWHKIKVTFTCELKK